VLRIEQGENLLLTGTMEIRLCDFGVSRISVRKESSHPKRGPKETDLCVPCHGFFSTLLSTEGWHSYHEIHSWNSHLFFARDLASGRNGWLYCSVSVNVKLDLLFIIGWLIQNAHFGWVV
jgi:hypothetical protein